MGSLADRAKELSPWIRLEDGETVTGKYLSWRETPSSFDPKKTIFQYELEVNGIAKYFNSGNKGIALIFDKLAKGSMVSITRKGQDRETRYVVTKV